MNLALRHFKRTDPVLYGAVRPHTDLLLTRAHDPFTGLCRIVIGQQVSTKAAHAIFTRFTALFSRNLPTPRKLARLPDETLRSAGLSAGKVRTLRALTTHLTKGLTLSALTTRSDIEIIATLTEIHGIGPWSAQMYLLFYLGREDVFSPGDLGLRTAIMRLYHLPTLPTPAEMEEISAPWRPYRSYACRILWQSLDNDPAL